MKTQERSIEKLGFAALTEKEMCEVRGGGDHKPKSRDKDVFDFDEE